MTPQMLETPGQSRGKEVDIEHKHLQPEAQLVQTDSFDTDEVRKSVEAYSSEESKRILRKIDYRLIPILALLYMYAFLDRSNIANAKIAGMERDLKLHGSQYNVALTLFFIPYSLLEVPSNIVLKLLKPSIWITIMVFSWGTVMTCMGFVQNYRGLLAARWFLGVAESGFFPAAIYILTVWYKRYEVQRRIAYFYVASSFSGAVSGLLAFAIGEMHGVGKLAGWRWLFILEGLLPVLTSFFIWHYLPDDPTSARFLTLKEREFIVNRLAIETGSGRGRVTNADKITVAHVVAALKEWKIWVAIVMTVGISIGVYGFSATAPTVIHDMGYTATNAQLMTIPIYLVAAIVTLTFAYISDRYEARTPIILAGLTTAAVGFIALLAIPHPKYPGLTYAMLFLVASGIYSPFPSMCCLVANNLAPSSKRAVGTAVLIMGANWGGIIGSNIYRAAEKPRYPTGFGVSLTVLITGFVATLILRAAFKQENKRRDAYMAEHGEEAIRSKYTEQELLDMGDKSPFFRYTL
ncbi:hypothetical protein FQN57_006530 [Myotisia sp. PD_48]|nr:hypothetical protein FQN57_006530 [Myotisia sp. PD_48]